MAATISVSQVIVLDNTQKEGHLECIIVVSGTPYPVGGIPFDSVILAVPGVTTNSGLKFTIIQSDIGSGYIYQRIPSTGTMMILQVPPNGSLTTAAPLQQIPSSTNMQGIQQDVIRVWTRFLRNA